MFGFVLLFKVPGFSAISSTFVIKKKRSFKGTIFFW